MIHGGVILGFLVSAAASASTGDRRHPEFKLGWQAVDRTAYAEAARHFQLYREAHPEDPAGWVMEGWVRRQLHQDGDSDSLFEVALRLDPNQPDAQYHFAIRAWQRRDLAGALSRLENIRDVASTSFEEDYHHMLGAVLLMMNREPRRAIDHLSRIPKLDEASRVLLAVAHLRLGDEAPARPILDRLCPAGEGEEFDRAWIRCLDKDYCGELLDERLEILRQIVRSSSAGGGGDALVAEAVRVHLRHRKPPAELARLLADASRRRPEACRLRLLEGLASGTGGPQAASQACGPLRQALLCAESGGDTVWPPFGGPLFDPATGAPLDTEAIPSLLRTVIARRCAR